MSDDNRSPALGQLAGAIEAARKKKEQTGEKTAKSSDSLLWPFLKAGLCLFCLWLLLMYGIGKIETSFLERTETYEKLFRPLAEKFATLNLPAEKPAARSTLKLDSCKFIVCWTRPDKNGRMIERIQYNVPEKRQPKTHDEVDLIVRLTLKKDRVYYSRGKFKTKFPIYDIVTDFIDVKKQAIVRSEIIKGDPTDGETNGLRKAPGTMPILDLQNFLASELRYDAAWAWHQLQ